MIQRDEYKRSAFDPQSVSGSTAINGTVFDALSTSPANEEHESFEVVVKTGAVSGTPTSFTITAQLQHSLDNSTWVNVDATTMIFVGTDLAASPGSNTPNGQSYTTLTAASNIGSFACDARGLHRYRRLVVTPAFTGGSSPAVLVDGTFIASRCRKAPVS
ncbi:MAG: hypothetical protein ACYCW6_00315 [Candidatus Xenobia bacterium]